MAKRNLRQIMVRTECPSCGGVEKPIIGLFQISIDINALSLQMRAAARNKCHMSCDGALIVIYTDVSAAQLEWARKHADQFTQAG
jgi:hypothetical protein